MIRRMKSSSTPCPLDEMPVICLKRCPYLRTHVTALIGESWRQKNNSCTLEKGSCNSYLQSRCNRYACKLSANYSSACLPENVNVAYKGQDIPVPSSKRLHRATHPERLCSWIKRHFWTHRQLELHHQPGAPQAPYPHCYPTRYQKCVRRGASQPNKMCATISSCSLWNSTISRKFIQWLLGHHSHR